MAEFVRYDIPDLANLQKKFEEYPKELQSEVEKAQKVNAIDLQSTARKLVQRGARSGRWYKRRKIMHQASAPGEPPKTDTGYLVNRIRGFVEHRFVAVLEAATKYARMLEFGTRKMGARPFMDRAGAIVLKRARQRLIDAARRTGRTIAKK